MSVDELRKKEKECRRLKHELSTEKEKFNQMVGKYQADLQTLQVGENCAPNWNNMRVCRVVFLAKSQAA